MSVAIVGRWGRNLAVRLPRDVVDASGLSEGERVEVETRDGDVVIRRAAALERADAERAAEEMLAEAELYPLDEESIRELIDEGRRA